MAISPQQFGSTQRAAGMGQPQPPEPTPQPPLGPAAPMMPSGGGMPPSPLPFGQGSQPTPPAGGGQPIGGGISGPGPIPGMAGSAPPPGLGASAVGQPRPLGARAASVLNEGVTMGGVEIDPNAELNLVETLQPFWRDAYHTTVRNMTLIEKQLNEMQGGGNQTLVDILSGGTMSVADKHLVDEYTNLQEFRDEILFNPKYHMNYVPPPGSPEAEFQLKVQQEARLQTSDDRLHERGMMQIAETSRHNAANESRAWVELLDARAEADRAYQLELEKAQFEQIKADRTYYLDLSKALQGMAEAEDMKAYRQATLQLQILGEQRAQEDQQFQRLRQVSSFSPQQAAVFQGLGGFQQMGFGGPPAPPAAPQQAPAGAGGGGNPQVQQMVQQASAAGWSQDSGVPLMQFLREQGGNSGQQ